MSLIRRRLLLAFAAAPLPWTRAFAGPSPASLGAVLYFISPHDGERVQSPVLCRFGLRGMGVAPAGVRFANTGHHHLLIDVAEPLDLNAPIPADKKHLHFGAGETEASVALAPGPHTLQLVLGDADHIPFNPPLVSKTISIVVA